MDAGLGLLLSSPPLEIPKLLLDAVCKAFEWVSKLEGYKGGAGTG